MRQVTFASVLNDQPQTAHIGTYPETAQGSFDPASRYQPNRSERNYWSDRMFSLQGQRMLRPCPNGKACENHLRPGMGGPHLPQAVNATFIGSQTDVDVLQNRPDYDATTVEGQMQRSAALELVSAEAFDKTLDGSDEFCHFTYQGRNIGYCKSPRPRTFGWKTTGDDVRDPLNLGGMRLESVGQQVDPRNLYFERERTYARVEA